MKAAELRNMSLEELRTTYADYEEEFLNLRFQAKLGQLSNPLQLRMLRREMARVKTVLNEKVREGVAA